MNTKKNRRNVYQALKNVKANISAAQNDNLKIVNDLGFESVDVVDLLFEIEQISGIAITIGDLNGYAVAKVGSRFQELTIKDLINYLNDSAK